MIDEFMYVLKERSDLFYSTIVPQNLPDDVVLFGLSSVDKDASTHTELMARKVNGVALFKRKRFTNVCQDCIDKGFDAERNCPHKEERLPAWISIDKFRWVEQVIEAGGDPMRIAAELYSTAAPESKAVFDAILVDRLFKAPPFTLQTDIPILCVAIDPNNGRIYNIGNSNHRSDFAIVTGFENHRRQFVFFGGETIQAKDPSEWLQPTIDHIKKIRSYPETQRSVILLSIENNVATNIHYIVTALKDAGLENFILYKEKDCAQHGFQTNAKTKEEMVMTMVSYLNGEGRLALVDTMVTTRNDPLAFKQTFQQQMSDFSRDMRAPKNGGQAKVIYTGKLTRRHKDDIIMASMICLQSFYKHLSHTLPSTAVDKSRDWKQMRNNLPDSKRSRMHDEPNASVGW